MLYQESKNIIYSKSYHLKKKYKKALEKSKVLGLKKEEAQCLVGLASVSDELNISFLEKAFEIFKEIGGDSVIYLYQSAGRDEREFDKADQFNITRPTPKRSISFGHGPHKCLGQHLARLEGRVILEEIFKHGCRYQKAGVMLTGLSNENAKDNSFSSEKDQKITKKGLKKECVL